MAKSTTGGMAAHNHIPRSEHVAHSDSRTSQTAGNASTDHKQVTYLNTVPPKVRPLFGKAYAGVASPRQAIQTKCLQCCHADRGEITHCTVTTCPLWCYRPYQRNSHTGGQ